MTRQPGAVAHHLLPEPPTDGERLLYLQRHLVWLMLASVLSFGALVISQIILIHQSVWLLILVPAFATTWIYYLVSAIVNLGSRSFDLTAHDRTVADAEVAGYLPSVDVFLPVCGEAAVVIANTWRHVAEMARHYPSAAHSGCCTYPGS